MGWMSLFGERKTWIIRVLLTLDLKELCLGPHPVSNGALLEFRIFTV